MKIYTSSEAGQNFATLLEDAQREGIVRIEHRDGQRFVLMPETARQSPLDVPPVMLGTPVTREDILASIAESRRDGDDQT